MPRYHEQFGRPLNADPGTRGVVESPTRGSSTKDLWAAFLGGITLIVVSALAGLYRGSLDSDGRAARHRWVRLTGHGSL